MTKLDKIHGIAIRLYNEVIALHNELSNLCFTLYQDKLINSQRYCERLSEMLGDLVQKLKREIDEYILIPIEKGYTLRDIKKPIVATVINVYRNVDFLQLKLLTDVLYKGIRQDKKLKITSLTAFVTILNRCRRVISLCFEILEVIVR